MIKSPVTRRRTAYPDAWAATLVYGRRNKQPDPSAWGCDEALMTLSESAQR